MKTFSEQLQDLKAAGYRLAEAEAKVAHDAVLFAMHKSGFKDKATVKGGVVMCELTTEVRRTTMDLDLDFVHCSISEVSIRRIVARWARLTGFRITIFGTVQELRQEDYRGKRIYLDISDGTVKRPVRTKVDIGVHTHKEILQVERRFQALADEKAFLLSNSKEQIFAEKLLSLIRHGIVSTRTKDVFDMYYLSQSLNKRDLKDCLNLLIVKNRKCPLHGADEILSALARTFASKRFLRDMASRKSNWLGLPPLSVTEGLMAFLRGVL